MRFVPSLLASVSLLALAGAMPAHAAFKIGSSNTAVIEPPIAVPNELPCEVALTTGVVFGANNADFNYAPPANCPGPWAKVVLSIDIRVQKGIQFDRTGTLWIGGVPFWFGTTSEPGSKNGPSWHVERDVTDYSALLTTPQSGFELITNYVEGPYTSYIVSSSVLKFYPATTQYPAPATPDLVLPLSAAGGGTVALNTGTDMLTTTVTLPTNVKTATLQVYTQGQQGDEFWYLCVPDQYANELDSCGGGAFREGEITVDGTPAGVAPVYPWIFTGGLDPYLWFPIPGVQTLNFTPFAVPLSPFAGVLSNGQPHTIGLSVYGANGYFSAAGALLVTLDPTTPTVTGSIKYNTLAAAPAVKVIPHLTTNAKGDGMSGYLNTVGEHNFKIVGEVMTSAGKVTNTVTQTTKFVSDEYFKVIFGKKTHDQQDLRQTTTTVVDETSVAADGTSSEKRQNLVYPLTIDYLFPYNAQFAGNQTVALSQQRQVTTLQLKNGQPSAQSSSAETINSTDILEVGPGFSIIGNKDQASVETLLITSSLGPCFQRTLAAANNVLTAAATGCAK